MFAADNKREFRGAWLHTVFQEQYLKNNTEENKRYLADQLDRLKASGINAVIFQVRPQADAFYDSRLEPWSIFLTGNHSAPHPYWDPLQFVIEQAHIRGMELHAWLNPYRVTSSSKQTLPRDHAYYRNPERFIKYGGKIYFDPGQPENISHIINVIADIVGRYDVDAIHMDDYFYPYPIKNVAFPDDKSYKMFGKGASLDDWRRNNVNRLIEAANERIKSIKPWVRFGISPFGIWRNKQSDDKGSETSGLENYDKLYADVLHWSKNGWVDYIMPQLYWAIENPVASYSILAEWWNRFTFGRHMFIGQDINITMKKADVTEGSQEQTQLKAKISQSRRLENISGDCWWPGYSISDNTLGIADSLQLIHYSHISLPPTYPWISNSVPDCVYNIHYQDGKLQWDVETPQNSIDDAVRYVVYRFDEDEEYDIDDSSHIVMLTGLNSLKVTMPGVYCVTALNRVNNESFPSEFIKIE